MPNFEKLTLPNEGEIITFNQGKPNVPNNPIVPFIRGDGTGVDIWPATQIVLDSAIKKSYGDERKINWFKVYAGDEACELYGTYNYLPQDTIEAIRHFGVAIKGPLTTPIGGGIRSLNVALRQIFDLYSCVRPVSYTHLRAHETSLHLVCRLLLPIQFPYIYLLYFLYKQ